jgi:hypothetical protein
MGKRAASLWLLSALAVGVAACSNDKIMEVNPNLPPTRYKVEILDTLRTVFDKNETQTVTNAMITDPALRPVGSDQRYTVCVRYTAHGTAYNLSANAERIAVFYGGRLNQLIEATQEQCGNAAYKPFPELNAVCLGKGCNR